MSLSGSKLTRTVRSCVRVVGFERSAGASPSKADAEECSSDEDDCKGGEKIKWRTRGDQGGFPFKDAGVLLARLRVDRRQICGTKPSRTVWPNRARGKMQREQPG